MSDALRAQEHCVIDIRVDRIAVAKRLAGVEDERDVDADLLLSLNEPFERREVVDERSKRVLVSHKVEAWGKNTVRPSTHHVIGNTDHR